MIELEFRIVDFCGGRKTREPREKPLKQGRESTANSTHIWRRGRHQNELPIRERDLLESSKIDILFQGIHKVLDCHVMFNILLSVNLYRCFHLQKYELPIRERDLLESSKIDILFQGIHKVLDCHVMFNIALSARMDEWNNEEKIGDILYALVSLYSTF
jgi:hypothetical protein